MKELLDVLLGKVQVQTTVIASNSALLLHIKDLLDKALANNPNPEDQAKLRDEIVSISDLVGNNTKAISDAILANTPAEPKTITLTAETGEVIVITLKDGEEVPTIGDTAKVNDATVTGGASYTFADGSSLTLDDSGVITAYSAAPAEGGDGSITV